MKNCVQAPSKIYTLTAPSGGVVSGTFYRIGQLILCAIATVAQGLPAAFAADGVYSGVPKATGQAWAEGALIYWSVANSNFTTTSASNILCGVAGAAANSGDTTGTLILDGAARITT